MNRLHLIPLLVAVMVSFAAAAAAPPVADVVPVTEDFFGTRITDPYRYMENLDDPKVKAWFQGQADYARAQLDGLSGRAAFRADLEKYVNSSPAIVAEVARFPNDQFFYLKTAAGQDLAKLFMRSGINGADVLLVDTDKFIGPHGEPPAINYYVPSPDGHYVAFGLSQGGSEMATLYVVDTQTGKQLPDQITRAEFGGVSWRPDNHSFFYNRMVELGPNSNPLDKEEKSKVYLHTLGDSPDNDAVVFGFGLSPGITIVPTDIPFVDTHPGCDYALGGIEHGVQVEQTMYAAPLAATTSAATPWTKVFDTDAGVSDYAVHGDDLYLLTHNDAPRYKIIHTSLSHPDLAHADMFVAQQSGVLRSVHAAADGLYVQELDGAIDNILRVPYGGGDPKAISVPFEGGHDVESADQRLPGVVLRLEAWTRGSRVAIYDPATDQVTPTDIQPAGPYDNRDDITSDEIRIPSYDGVLVPLSIIHRKDVKLDGTNPAICYAYGGYGITNDSGFSPTLLAWLDRGGVYALAHVRGGGELGEPWHLGAQKLTKPNVWRDLIACCKYLIAQKYTSPSHLGISGGSNGGITIGRAITERPDLFAAAFIRAGVMNALRSEFSPNGPPNIPEYGSVTTQEGFEDLYAMDAYQHIRDGVRYPAVLEYTGVNDPRVPPWEPAKMTARLQAATASDKPILLDVDYQGGHGIGMSKKQRIDSLADMYSFFLWQFGDPAFLQHASLHPNIEYANAGGQSLKLDAAVPDGTGPFPVAILVHGGGWSSGDKQHEFPVMFQALSAAHFTWFSIDYRLAPKNKWPACFDDVQSAIRWVKSHAGEFKGDPNRIALIGYSAGGELATLAAVTGSEDTAVAAVVGFAPPTDMEADTARRNGLSTSLKNLFGTTSLDAHAHALLREMSPIDFLHPGLPPFLLVQGNADKSVSYAETLYFQQRLKALGTPCDLMTIDTGPHDVLQWEALQPDYREQVIRWLQQVLVR